MCIYGDTFFKSYQNSILTQVVYDSVTLMNIDGFLSHAKHVNVVVLCLSKLHFHSISEVYIYYYQN